MPIVRPTADLSRGTWQIPAGQASLAAAVDDDVSPDGIAPVAYLRDPTDLPGMIGAGIETAPHAPGHAAAYAPSSSRSYGVLFGSTATFHYEFGRVHVPQAARTAPQTPRPLVVYLHGATATESQLNTNPDQTPLLDDWLARGWPVVQVRQGVTVADDGTDSNDGKYGNNTVRDGFRDLFTWLTRLPFSVSKLLLYGFSAGGNATVNFLLESLLSPTLTIPIAGAMLVDPLTSLRWGYTSGGAAIRADIKAAHAVPNGAVAGDAAWIAAVDTPRGGHDGHVVSLAQLPSIPFRVECSHGDGTVDDVSNGVAFKDRLIGASWPHAVQFLATTGDHGATSHFDVTRAATFLTACVAGTL